MIISAYVMPHPPLAVPEVGGGREAAIAETTNAMDAIAREIAKLKPDTIIYITPHGTVYGDYFHVSSGEGADGDFSRFGVNGEKYSVKYDSVFADGLAAAAKAQGFPMGTDGAGDPSLDHAVLVPMHFINKHYADYKAVRVSPSGLSVDDHIMAGKMLAEISRNLNRCTVIIASADLSHKLSAQGPYGLAPEGEIFDREIMQALSECDFAALTAIDPQTREKAAECGYLPCVMLSGAIAGSAPTARQLSYEAPFGVGYGVVAFSFEDAYRSLARLSLETRVKTGQELPQMPDGIPQELLTQKAGAFVSLHIDGDLRGCIGTIAPTTNCVALEIIQNAVSAGLRDPRFPPVAPHELPLLAYKVDILDPPEQISDPDLLDVKQYGVIVESGIKRGLLLPNLDGIDTIEAQITIACQKAGITPSEPITLKRFKVTRYE